MERVPSAWWELETGFEMLAQGEMCFEGMEALEKEVPDVGTGYDVF